VDRPIPSGSTEVPGTFGGTALTSVADATSDGSAYVLIAAAFALTLAALAARRRSA